jgi:hypothetical protein
MNKSSFVSFISTGSAFVNCVNGPHRQKSNITQMKQACLLSIVNLINIAINMMNGSILEQVAQWLEIDSIMCVPLGLEQ